MASNPIASWLAGDRNFQEGLSIFEKFSDKEFTKNILKGGEGSITSKILVDEMEALASTLDVVVDKPNAIWRGDDFKDLPDLVKTWIEEMKLLYKKNQHRKSQLESMVSVMERGDLCNMILDDEEIIEKYKHKINYYQLHRKLPPEVTPYEFDPEEFQPHEVLKKIKLLSSQISKQKKNPLRQDDVTRWEAEKEKLNQILNAIV